MIRLIVAIVLALVASPYTLPQHCMTGPVEGYSGSQWCYQYDEDADNDVDLSDWADWIIENPSGIPIWPGL